MAAKKQWVVWYIYRLGAPWAHLPRPVWGYRNAQAAEEATGHNITIVLRVGQQPPDSFGRFIWSRIRKIAPAAMRLKVRFKSSPLLFET